MSKLPNGWENVGFKDFFKTISAKKYQIQKKDYLEKSLYPVIDQGQKYIVAYSDQSDKVLNNTNGLIIFGDHTRIIKFIDFDFVIGADGTQILNTPDNVDIKFAYYTLLSKEIVSLGYSRHFKIVKEFSYPLPPLEEQKKIADILSTVDQKIAFVEDNISQTQELKKGLMQKLLTQGLGHTEFKDTKIGNVPSSWEVVKLSETIDIMTDYVANGSFASLAENVNVYDEPNYAIYVRLFDLRKGLGHENQKYVDQESYKFLSKSNLEGREILIANIGANVGETFLMPNIDKPATLAPNMIEVKVDQEKLISEFLYFYLTGHIGLKELEKVTEGSGQPKINKTKLKTINVPLPDLEEQSKIIEILSVVDQKLEVLKDKKESFEELKKGLMQKLLTGEVRV